MKKNKSLTSTVLLLMMCFMFAACPEPEPNEVVRLNLIGVWEYSHSGGYDLYQFNNDGTGNGIDSDGYYWNFEYDLNAETLRLVYAKENESAEIWNIDVISNSSIEINNEMVLTRTTEKVERYKAVDLGLSVKWATCNVGASKPEDYGDYYAWGEIVTKSNYDWETYKWCKGTSETLTKYCTNSDYGTVDNCTTLASSDDVATVKWGDKWRMPTLKDIKELVEECTWAWTTQNGVNGMKVTGPNGNCIFLPAAGNRLGTDFYNRFTSGLYGSATLHEHTSGYYARGLYFYSGGSDWSDGYGRRVGFTVRPVKE